MIHFSEEKRRQEIKSHITVESVKEIQEKGIDVPSQEK